MSNEYKYAEHGIEGEPEYDAYAQGVNMESGGEWCEEDFAICFFPNTNEDHYVLVPVISMVDNLIADYGDEAKPILSKFMIDLNERIKET